MATDIKDIIIKFRLPELHQNATF